ncbi:hypothetical protein LS73_008180 [Helicobacter muridarum]|uniref:Type I restriction-modification system subunit R n=1 Tax=Helicobacter muridarum TaxID=216 RepID=A0A099U155_9HELI|nr:hypothetical protein [Helicobacter muridarum]TLD98794.1 hypothetical protein LS73_008180 [Helicobacter muridarum]STQ85771.1 Type I restriction-modification system subunit R [Helicobacter muridarum]
MQETKIHSISQNDQSTIVAKFTPSSEKERHYESEKELESKFIKILQKNGYEYSKIKNEESLINNLKIQMQRLNNCEFNANE